jgi:DNA excision repair protein ERCC-3
MVLCTSSVAVEQWKREFCKWSTIDPDKISRFTSVHKEKFTEDIGILITSYSMMGH